MERDIIYRQAAIDAINTWDKFGVDERGRLVPWHKRSVPYVSLEDVLKTLVNLPAAEPERKAPTSDEEQLSLDCSFCRQHECGDRLYESSDWDGGIGFDYIRDIRFCPICERKLYGYE